MHRKVALGFGLQPRFGTLDAMGNIFISHSSVDMDRAREVLAWLTANGWDDVFLDLDPERGIAAGWPPAAGVSFSSLSTRTGASRPASAGRTHCKRPRSGARWCWRSFRRI